MSHATPRAAMRSGDFLMLCLIASIWGTNSFLWKLVVDELPPLFAAGARFIIVPLLLLPYLRVPEGGLRSLLFIAFLIGPIHFGIQSIGLAQAVDLSPMVIAMQLWIPASVLIASLWLGEHVQRLRLIGIIGSFFGIAVMAGDPRILSQGVALGLVALAAIAYATGIVAVRRRPSLHPLTLQAWIAMITAPCLLLASAAFEQDQIQAARAAPWYVWAAMLFSTLSSSIFANSVMFSMAARYEVSRTTPFMFLSPIIGVTLGWIVLDDPLSALFLLGAAITLGGVALVSLAERRGQ